MGVGERLRRQAFARPRAFPVLGHGGGERWHRLVAGGLVEPTRAPHDSDLLVLAGEIPEAWSKPLAALFETLALPRLAVWLQPAHARSQPRGLPLIELDPVRPDMAGITDRLLDLEAPNNRPVLADEPPTPWRGKGDHGQGGEGMMGGTPYGRPMAMVGNDPDGLMLGALTTSLGPFFPGLPSGLQLQLTLQGDRVGSVDEVTNWFPQRSVPPEPEVVAAGLERARIASHLRWMASFLDLAGLPALARRFLTHSDTTDPRRLKRLFRAAGRTGLGRVLGGVGQISREQAEGMGLVGPCARASGIEQDARIEDPAYAGVGFETVTAREGDAWARWQVRARECLQSAELIERLGDRMTGGLEGPRGLHGREGDGFATASRANLTALPHVVSGALWPDAVLAISSLDLDMAEAALR